MSSRYWVGGTDYWDDRADLKWSYTSGGSGGAPVPTADDDVYFDANSGAVTVTINNMGSQSPDTENTITVECNKLICTGFTGTLTAISGLTNFGSDLDVYDDFILDSGMTLDIYTNLYSSTPATISCNGATITGTLEIYYQGETGGYTLGSDLTSSGPLYLWGAIDTDGYDITCDDLEYLRFNDTTTGESNLRDSIVTTTGYLYFENANDIDLNFGTSTIVNDDSSNTFNLEGDKDINLYNLTITGTSNYCLLYVNPGMIATFNNLSFVSTIYSEFEFQGSGFIVNGTLTITGGETSERVFCYNLDGDDITINAPTVSLSNVDFEGVTATGSTWSGTSIGNAGNNSGITFTTPVTRYAISAGDTSDTAIWSATDGGAGGASVPLCHDTVYINANSGVGSITHGQIFLLGKNVDFTGYTGTFAQGSNGVAVTGSVILDSGMTWTSSGPNLTFYGQGTQNLTTNGKTFPRGLRFYGSGSLELLDAITLNTSNDFGFFRGTLNTNNFAITTGTFTSSVSRLRVLNLGSSTITLSSTWAISGSNITLNSGTSVITSSGGTFTGGGYTYSTLNMTNSGATIKGANTFSVLTVQPTALATLAISDDQTVSTTLNISGNSVTNRLKVSSSTKGTQKTITCNGAITLTNVDFLDIVGAGSGTWSGTSVGNGGNNSGITFTTPVTRYWVGGTGNWNSTGEWSTSSGGATGASVPLVHDTVVFDTNSFTGAGQILTLNTALWRPTLDFTNATNNPTLTINSAAELVGSITLKAGMTVAGSSNFSFINSSPVTLTSAGVSWVGNSMTINCSSTITLADAFTSTDSSGVILTTGTFDANDQDLSIKEFTITSNSLTRVLNMGTGTWTLTGTGVVWDTGTTTNLTLNCETSTVKITDASSSSKTFEGASKTYYNLWLTGAGTGAFIITGSNTFNDFKVDTPPHTVTFPTIGTQTVTSFTVSGTAGNLMTLQSSATGGRWILRKTSGTIQSDYLHITDSYTDGDCAFSAGANSTNNARNDGWAFSTPSVNQNFSPFYQLLTN